MHENENDGAAHRVNDANAFSILLNKRDWPPLPKRADSQPPSKEMGRRRDHARHLSVGAPISASFIGLLALDEAMAWTAEANETAAGERSEAGVASDMIPPEYASDRLPVAEQKGLVADESGGPQSNLEVAAAAGPGSAPEGGEIASKQNLSATPGGEGAAMDSVEDQAVNTSESSALAGDGNESESAASDEYPEEDIGTIGERIVGGGGDDVLVGTENNDTIFGGEGDDRISGLGGNDVLDGGGGDDRVEGGAGDDLLFGRDGDDNLIGGAGDDTVLGGAGDDRLDGGSGDDELDGGAGDDRLIGGAGSDVLRGSFGNDRFVLDDYGDITVEHDFGADGGGIDTLEVTDGFGESLASRLPGAAPDGLATFVIGGTVGRTMPGEARDYTQQVAPEIENVMLTGTAAHDVVGSGGSNEIFGNDGANRLWGDGGDDKIAGGASSDRLFGGDGDDWLAGEDGEDFLFGEGGDDSFLFGLNDSAVDTVFDHEGVNKLRIEGGTASQLEARMDGDDLMLRHGDKDILRIQDFAGHEGAFSTIETGDGEVTSLSELIGGQSDILSAFLAPASAQAAIHGLQDDATDVQAADLLQPFLSATDPLTGETDQGVDSDLALRDSAA